MLSPPPKITILIAITVQLSMYHDTDVHTSAPGTDPGMKSTGNTEVILNLPHDI